MQRFLPGYKNELLLFIFFSSQVSKWKQKQVGLKGANATPGWEVK